MPTPDQVRAAKEEIIAVWGDDARVASVGIGGASPAGYVVSVDLTEEIPEFPQSVDIDFTSVPVKAWVTGGIAAQGDSS